MLELLDRLLASTDADKHLAAMTIRDLREINFRLCELLNELRYEKSVDAEQSQG